MRFAKTILALLLASLPAFAQDKKPEPAPLKIKVGDVAPDFTLLAFDGQKVAPVSSTPVAEVSNQPAPLRTTVLRSFIVPLLQTMA